MASPDLKAVLDKVLDHGRESEWIEFKHNNADPEQIGQYISAVSNSAALHRQEHGYVVWGIEDGSLEVVGTSFKPFHTKVGNEELVNWIATQLEPRVHFEFFECELDAKRIILLEVQRCPRRPVGFKGTEYIRVGSYKKKLKDHPEKERLLWSRSPGAPFESEIVSARLDSDEVLRLIDHSAFFEISHQPLPETKSGLLDRLAREKLIQRSMSGDCWDITKLGAILFARRLDDFDGLARKAVRVIHYRGRDRVHTIKEYLTGRGYAAAFEGLVTYVDDQLPRNEEIPGALRKEGRQYPLPALRELIANAIIHQDFSMTGVSPMVEIFVDRVEITNPGTPLIETLRFIDEPPQSRNEALASLMRRLNICEERGSGIDKVIFEVEAAHLPPPEFLHTDNHTKAVLFGPRKLSEMDRRDKVRACYQHACLLYVSNLKMTNASLRLRLGIAEQNYATASRIIADTIEKGLVQQYDRDSASRRHAAYVPFWA